MLLILFSKTCMLADLLWARIHCIFSFFCQECVVGSIFCELGNRKTDTGEHGGLASPSSPARPFIPEWSALGTLFLQMGTAPILLPRHFLSHEPVVTTFPPEWRARRLEANHVIWCACTSMCGNKHPHAHSNVCNSFHPSCVHGSSMQMFLFSLAFSTSSQGYSHRRSHITSLERERAAKD